jgi:hypothetical protein
MRRTRRKLSPAIVPLLVLAAVSFGGTATAATPGPPAGGTLKSWTVTGKGHCVRNQLVVYNPGSLSEGDLLQWLASSTVCDAAGAKPVWGLKLRAKLLLPPVNCAWIGMPLSDQTVWEGTTQPTHGGAVTYYEYGDGHSAPAQAVGTVKGNRPTALGLCTGPWRIQFEASVIESPAAPWKKVGTSTFDLTVGHHPQFDENRPGHVVGDKTTNAKGHCLEQKFIRYGRPQAAVGDLLEWISLTHLCDGSGAAPVYGFSSDLSITPPKGCPAPSWMTNGGASNMSWSPSRPGATMAYARYGDGVAGYPPDWPSDAGGGAAPAMVVVNCPGTWKITHKTAISEDPNSPPSLPVAQASFTFDVLPTKP